MSAFTGMDTEAVREQAARCAAAAAHVDLLRATLTAVIEGADWTGPDAIGFRSAWADGPGADLARMAEELRTGGATLAAQADEQDQVSAADGDATVDGTGSAAACRTPETLIPPATNSGDRGYRHQDNPWIPNWLEDPAEAALARGVGTIGGEVRQGVDTVIGLAAAVGDLLGLQTGGLRQMGRDMDRLGSILTDLGTGERVPAIAEVAASTVVVIGSTGAAGYELLTGRDTAFLDDRGGGIVRDVATTTGPQPSPQTLQDLVLGNDALRVLNPEAHPLEAGQIGVQQVRGADGATAYIVQIPPTEGAPITSVPAAYGGQGDSRDWGSNLRLVAGQHPAAMDDVQAAMRAAGIPPGAHVMLVGHSQGGIVADHLAADPAFNNCSGREGSYDVTHVFTVGAPVQTVVPAQAGTQSVNVSHRSAIGPEGVSGDLIAELDLGGRQLTGGVLGAPNQHEVSLPGYPTPSANEEEVLRHNHDSVGTHGETDLGYAGSVARATGTDPTLSALQRELTGTYIGEGTEVTSSSVITVGREPRA